MSEPFELENLLGFHLARLSSTLAAAAQTEAEEVAGLSLTEYRIMMALLTRGPTGVAELQRIIFVDKAWISRVVPRLLYKGFVSSGSDPDDARRTLLTLTDEGLRTARKLKERAVARQERVLGDLTPSERANLLALLVRLQKSASNVTP